MASRFDANVQKSAVIPAPFRRRLFEPAEPPLDRPMPSRFLIRPAGNAPPPPREPFIGPEGQEYFRLSHVKILIELELQKTEAEVHEEYVKRLAAFLAEAWQDKAEAAEAEAHAPLSYIW
jgi:hypothetical protein